MKELTHDVEDLITIFNDEFYQDFNTRLVRGDDEPVYLPASADCSYHQIIFAHGYYTSALHEIAHWCLAGQQRRQLEDYGYWYCPDGRDEQQQAEFEKVEVKPQAIEWGLSICCGIKFNVSTDNLNGAEPDRERFTQNVYEQLQSYKAKGFPKRAQMLMRRLSSFYQQPDISQLLNQKEVA